MTDLVTRLRHYNSALMDEAADRINALEKALRAISENRIDAATPAAYARHALSANTAFSPSPTKGATKTAREFHPDTEDEAMRVRLAKRNAAKEKTFAEGSPR